MRLELILVAAVAALAAAAPAAAAAPEPVTIAMHGHFTGPSSVAGTWEAVGAVTDAGTYVETFRITGDAIHGEKVLTGSQGTIVIAVNAVVVWLSPTLATFRAGAWRIVSGTGAYAGLRGGGHPGASGFGDLATNTVEVAHEGQVDDD